MTCVFRVFYSKINSSPDKATKVVFAAVVLHNMLRTGHANTLTPPGFEVNARVFQPLLPHKNFEITPNEQAKA